MKKILLIVLVGIGFLSCDNFNINHPDFDYTSGYFPYQYPVRTLVLGDYIYDNSNDNDQKFIISVAMGGVYENNQDRVFDIEVDESLSEEILFSEDGDTIQTMPSDYYSLSDDDRIVIPSGELNGGVEVQLTDAFFDDPRAIKLGYIIPIRLKSSTDVDTILVGDTVNPDADPRVSAQWNESPKNFTMFAVKYINEYHGTYFHYGENNVRDETNTVVEDNIYREDFIVDNSTSKLVTTGRNEVSLSTHLNSEIMEGEVNMLLNFDGDNCTITAAEGSSYAISGSGVFKAKEYEWGNKDRNGIELDFTVSDGENTYEASDVLVLRDKDIVMETYSPVVY